VRFEEARRKRGMCVAAMDIRKAFDMVERGRMMKVLVRNGVEDELLKVIGRLNEEEWCEVMWEGEALGVIKKNRGIRQGCKISPLLFVLGINETVRVMNKIWKETTNVLLYADDAVILAENVEELRRKLRVYKHSLRNIGLEVNEEKSRVMVIGKEMALDEVEGIEVVSTIKYLGVEMDSGGQTCRRYVERRVTQARSLVSWIWAVTQEKYYKAAWAKAMWKNIILPKVMHGWEVIPMKRGHLDRMDKIQNRVMRMALSMPRRTAVEYLRGEVGVSTARER
ncbi:MAG: reverse transcriptase domain-containing protein, partial [Pseudomonadota bacterium]